MNYMSFFHKTLRDLVEIPSISQNEKAVAQYLVRVLNNLGYEAEIQPIHENCCNVISRVKGGGGATVLLSGHIDTVTPGEGWTHDPYVLSVEGNRAYGRGSGDMKGGIAAYLALLYRYKEEGLIPGGDIIFAALADEERMSDGAHKLAQSGIKADFCILAEPHYDEIIIGSTGKTLLEVCVFGEKGHAARPETGKNAIDAMAALLQQINKEYTPKYIAGEIGSHCVLSIENKFEGYSLNIPDDCKASLNKQLMPGESLESVIADVYKMFNALETGCRLEIKKSKPNYPAYITDTQNIFFQKLHSIVCRHRGEGIPLRINQSVTDGNIIEPIMGIPTAVYGPKGVDFHKPDEYLALDTVEPYIETLYEFIGTSK